MTGLLVSVRDESEAAVAFRGGVGLLDVKEPLHGSLGAAEWPVWKSVAKLCDKWQIPMSVAVGELSDLATLDRCGDIPLGTAYAKCGLAGMRSVSNWQDRWQQFVAALPRGTQPVLVHYADSTVADSPRFEAITELLATDQPRALLIDTFEKVDGKGLLQLIELEVLEAAREATLAKNQLLVLAGSLTLNDLEVLSDFVPDWVAVRGAVCASGRTSEVCEERVQTWVKRVAAIPERNSRPSGTAFVNR